MRVTVLTAQVDLPIAKTPKRGHQASAGGDTGLSGQGKQRSDDFVGGVEGNLVNPL